MKTQHIAGFEMSGLKTYVIGYGLSIVLTIIPFILVMKSTWLHSTIAITIAILAVVQVVVHITCFLHMRFSSDQTWNWLAFIYTLILLFILIGASFWIMFHLNTNMMMTHK